jgi:small conductance mechanosensitive channel
VSISLLFAVALGLMIFTLGLSAHAQDQSQAPAQTTGASNGEGDGGLSLNAGMIQELAVEHGLRVIGVIVLVVLGLMISKWVSRLTLKSCEKAELDLTLSLFFAAMVRWLLLIILGLFILSVFGVETTSFAAVLAVAGFAIGMGLQGTLGNFSSGVMPLIFRPFKVGDVICVSGVTAKVSEIQLFATILDTPDNRWIIIPNGSVFGSTIENITFHPVRRVDVAVGTEYPADLDKARSVLTKAAEAVEGRLGDRDVATVLLEMADSSINWSVRVWANTSDHWAVRDRLTRDIKVALDGAGVGIPFPQMDVHLDQVSAA